MSKAEVYNIQASVSKQRHDERVAKTPQRIDYAVRALKDAGVRYKVMDSKTGHIHAFRLEDGQLMQFWAGTGKILGQQNFRGIRSFIKMLTKNANRKRGNPFDKI